MRTNGKLVSIVALVSFVMAVIRSIIIQYDMEKNYITPDTYYLPDNAEVIVFSAATVAFIVFFVFCAVMCGKGRRLTLGRSFGAVPAGSLVLAFSLIGAAAVYIAGVVREGIGSATVLGILILIATLLSAAKFTVSGIGYNRTLKNTCHALAAIAPTVLCILRLLGDFIRTSAAPLASSGAYHILGLCTSLIYFLTEGKSYVVKTSGAVYYAFGYLSVFFLFVYAIPNLFMHCFGMFEFNYYAAYSVVDIGVAVYIITRLSSAKFAKEPISTEQVTVV